jgi:hypothetical protein
LDEIGVRQPALKRAKLLINQSAHVSQYLQVLIYDLYVRPCHAWLRPCREYFAEFGFLLILPLVGTGCNCQKLRAIPKRRTTSCSSGRVRIDRCPN